MSKKSNKKYVNVVHCEELGQGKIELLLLAAGLSSTVPLDNVFSTNSLLYLDPVFTRIQQRFGQNCVMIHVTSDPRHFVLHGNHKVPVWWISSNESVLQLYKAQRNILSK